MSQTEWKRYKPTRYFDNARLAVELAIELGAKGTSAGSMSHFSKVQPDWICPGCGRTKSEIARLNKHGDFYCALHFHHDHISEQVCEVLGVNWYTAPEDFKDRLDQHPRFTYLEVCMDCNRVDAQAKRILKAPRHFSFSAKEIRQFVIVAPRVSHQIDVDKARRVFAPALLEFNDLVENVSEVIRLYEQEMLQRARAKA